jgi:hypothetical protein
MQNRFIDDQQTSLAELNRERALLAEQRAEFSVSSRLKNEELQRTTAKSLQVRLTVRIYASVNMRARMVTDDCQVKRPAFEKPGPL